MTSYAAQKGIEFKYSLCEACINKNAPDKAHECGILNTLTTLGEDMGFHAPVFYCEKFERNF